MRLILCEKFPLRIILRQVYQKVKKSSKYDCNLFIEELKSFLKKKFLERNMPECLSEFPWLFG